MIAATGKAVRVPAFAGVFYPAAPELCREQARELLEAAPASDGRTRWIGGVVPHAGWMCSGAVAGQTIAAIAAANREREVGLVVIFGAVHSAVPLDRAALDSYASWREPAGLSEVSHAVRDRLAEASGFVVDDEFHRREHAIEVELPLVQATWPAAAILPVEVPPLDAAAVIGTAVAKEVSRSGLRAIYLASSDLTHYGPGYGFAPGGVGQAGLRWAGDNDRRMLELIERFEPAGIVSEARRHGNACGPGAIAAMLAAARESGARTVRVLRHTNSYETLSAKSPQPADNAVGYASVVVG